MLIWYFYCFQAATEYGSGKSNGKSGNSFRMLSLFAGFSKYSYILE